MKFLNKIDGASKIITDPSNRFITDSEKAGLHTHSNKAVVDKLTEVNGELMFNGEPVVPKTAFTWAKLKNSMSWADLIGI